MLGKLGLWISFDATTCFWKGLATMSKARSRTIVALLGGAGLLAQTALADGLPTFAEAFYGVTIENVHVTQGQRGENAKVTFIINNFSYQDVFLQDISSDASSSGELFYKGAFGQSTVESGLPIMQEETLDLSSSHIGARLIDLNSGLLPGDHLTFKLHFRQGQIAISTHVSPQQLAAPSRAP